MGTSGARRLRPPSFAAALARAAVRAARWRSRTTLRMRTASGVTSTHSSSRQNSSALLEAELARRDDLLEVVGGGGAHVGQLLLLGDVDVHVVGAGVLADDHALVDLGGRLDEQGAALLEVDHRVRGDDARAVGHQRAAGPGRDRAEPRLVVLEDVVAMPVPRVSVRNSVRKPISPRDGTRNSIRIQPVPWLVICSIRPLRAARSWVIAPRYSSGVSMVSRSTGSWILPSISR